MQKSFFLLSVFLILFSYSCDDGDIITVEFKFEDTFQICGDLVFYKTKSDPAESLSLQITSPSLSLDEILNVGDDNTLEISRTINGSSNTFNYRTYKTLPSNLFCNDVPPADIQITQDLSSTTGTAIISSTLTEDDNDGIPAELEDINGNGDLNDDDTDGDGLANYLDFDDDGDNIPTKEEKPDLNGDGIFIDARDTDSDGTPDYLDADDDGDGINTRDEENDSTDQNPANDVTNNDVADYLNPEVKTYVAATAYREHAIKQTYEVRIIINNIQLPNISQDVFDFGSLENSALSKTRKVTPTF